MANIPPRKILLIVIAAIIGLGTMGVVRALMTPEPAAPGAPVTVETKPESNEVVVATHDIPAGTLLKDSDLRWQVLAPGESMSENYISKGKKELSDFYGAVVRRGLRSGDPVPANRIVRANEQGFLAAVLTPGMRAITIPITPASGVAGFAFPGDRVDVIVTHQIIRKGDSGNTSHRVSETMLSDVRVLALDQKTDDQSREAKVAQLATLEVSPKQAEKLALITEMGNLSLILRSIDGETDPAAEAAAAHNDLGFTWDSDVSNVLAKPGNRNGQLQRVQIMRGKDSSETIFDTAQ